jgi:hypothetical protein
MPQVVIAAAAAGAGTLLASSATIAATSAFAGFAAGTAAAFFAKSFVASVVLGGLSQALAKKPIGGAGGYSFASRQAVAPRNIVYGRARVGGTIVYINSTGSKNKFLHMIIALAAHEVDEVEKVFFDDQEITLDGNNKGFGGKATIIYRLGTDDQEAIPSLLTDNTDLDSNFRLRGVAYAYVKLEFDANRFPTGVPAISFLVRGKKVFDPRSQATTWSTNPALCLNDYLTNARYGLGVNYSNEIDSASLIASANICEEQVPLDAGGFENKYDTNGSILTSGTPEDVINAILGSMSGKAVFTSGKWRILAGAYYTPALTFDEDDLRSGFSVQTLISRRENFNSIKGVFTSAANRFVPSDFPPIVSNTFIAQDNGEQVFKNIELPLTVSASMAQRLAKIELLKARQPITLTLPMKLHGLQANVGDIVNINNTRMGWSSKPFEVVSINMAISVDLGVDLELREISTDVYDWNASEEQPFDPAPNTNFPDPFDVATPTNLVLSQTNVVVRDGTTQAGILVTWTQSDNAFVDQYEVNWIRGDQVVTYGLIVDASTQTINYGLITDEATFFADYGSVADPTATGESEYNSIFVTQPYHVIAPAFTGAVYVIRVRALNSLGVGSGYATATITTFGDTDAPGVPTNIQAVGGYREVTLTWINPTVADFDVVDIYRSDTNNLATAIKISTLRGSAFVDAPLPNNALRYYWLQAFDRSGNASDFSSPVSATTQLIGSDSFNQEVLNLFSEAGAYGIEPVATLPAQGDFDGQIKYQTSLNKLYRWDAATSSWTDDIFSITAGTVDEASFAAGLEPVKIVTSLPNPVGYTGSKIVYLTSDNKLYRYDGSAWTSGIAASDINGTLAASNFSQQLRPVEVVSTLPSTGLFAGRTVVLTTDSKLYRYDINQGWTASVPASDLSGSISASQIEANSITSGQIAAGAIDADLIAANAITTGKIAAAAITADQIAVNAITAEKILAGEIQTDKIAANAITGGLIAASGVITTAAQIDDGVITNAKIANAAIDSAKIANVLQSSNYQAGVNGWKIEKTGNAEFNGVVLSRQLLVASGNFTIGNRTYNNSPDLVLSDTFFVETTVASTAWTGTNETYMVLIETNFTQSQSTVFALNTNINTQPQNIQWGWIGEVIPITRWSGNQRLWAKVEFFTRLVDRIENFTITWKLIKVT